jgi:putative transcriptional regulator
MSRSALVGNVTAMLEDAGFVVSDRCAIRPKSFDVAARRGNDVLLLKILGNIDAFDAKTGAEMRRLGEYLHATALVIGLRTRDEELDPGVVYFRHGVPVFSPDTALELFVDGVPPLIYAAPGGLYVNIDSEVLADAREDRDWSLGQLAQELGVSRRRSRSTRTAWTPASRSPPSSRRCSTRTWGRRCRSSTARRRFARRTNSPTLRRPTRTTSRS